MRLKRLELQGFKSFLDRTILSFEPGITGVVGPNGCGKSNIVDAIQWVMGEQSAKHLRGESMTDVIFNGSDSRAATSMAEVTLVMERMGTPLSPAFAAFEKADEIAITRRVYRDGSGEFLINRTACRLKDIHELFMDTGVGKRAYSIIEQGQIDRMINVKPEERRHIFEEVAGITKYKAKKKEAEKKLDLTRQNLLRIQDIVTELEKQLRSLKVQAGRARKYKELKTELEYVDGYFLGRKLYEYTSKVSSLIGGKDQLVTDRSEAEAQFAEVDAKVTELEIKRIDLEKEIGELNQQERDLSLSLQRMESLLELNAERLKNFQSALEANQTEELDINRELEQLKEEAIQLEQEVAEITLEVEGIETRLSEVETEIAEVSDVRKLHQKQKEEVEREIQTVSNKVHALDATLQYQTSREQEFVHKEEELKGRQEGVQTHLTETQTRLASMSQSIEEKQAHTLQLTEAASSLDIVLKEKGQSLSEKENEIFQTREQLQIRSSRKESLEELQKSLEGYSPSVREILTKLGDQATNNVLLGEVLSPASEIEDHLEVLLGDLLNTVLVPNREAAETISKMVERDGLERVTVLALDEVPEASTIIETQKPTLLSRVTVTPGYEKIAAYYLQNIFLCDNSEELYQLRLTYPTANFLSIAEKTYADSDRKIAAGKPTQKAGVFARKREIHELSEECTALQATVASLNTERDIILAELEEQEKNHTELKEKISSAHIELVGNRKEREAIQLEVSRAGRDAENLQKEMLRLEEQVGTLREDLVRSREEQAVFKTELAEKQESRSALEVRAFESEEKLKLLQERKSGIQVESSRLAEKKNSLEYRFERVQSDQEHQENRKVTLLENRERDQLESEKILGQNEKFQVEKVEIADNRNEILARLSQLKEEFSQKFTDLQDLQHAKQEWQKKREDLLTQIQELELKLTQLQSNIDQIKAVSIERYQMEVAPISEAIDLEKEKLPMLMENQEEQWNFLSHEERLNVLEVHLTELREKASRYGEVNLTAIQEFDEVQKRYDFLMEQKGDLEKSIQILEEAIVKIDTSTLERFEDTFHAVNKKFQEIFPILFNGGKAELALTQAENILDAGIDILVHPPGKKPSSITLLSGGEKALTAVSLVLAIFARKPSPFCLLDEVDAPLDDANVSRFNTVVRKMAEKTQFILITHNKKTMEVAQALYGVTMERAGVSKMTSVRLN